MQQSLIAKAFEYAKVIALHEHYSKNFNYYKHTIRLVDLLKSIGMQDENTLAAAVLHDSFKHEIFSPEEITKEFNSDVTYILQKYTQISHVKIPNVDDKNIVNFHKLIVYLSEDIRVLLIRLAYKLDSIRHVTALPREKQVDIAHKAIKIYAFITSAVGLYAFTKEIQNAALKILEPDIYSEIENIVSQKSKHQLPKINRLKKDIAEFFMKENITDYSVTARTKSIYSIYAKLLRKAGIINTEAFQKINDFYGIRILLNNVDDCYRLMAYIQERWEMVEGEYDDYISKPKTNGYKTLQTTFYLDADVMCEVQIKTYEMHEFNEYGPASHLLSYKSSNIKHDSSWVKNLIKMKNDVTSQNEITRSPKTLFEDTIFVFTPQNDLITLPGGSTTIDFAYAVHTNIGNHATGAKINGNITKLDTLLKSGDTIEILTSNAAKPSIKWLEFVKTQEARKNIKHLNGLFKEK